jgi:hypothetical protein
MASDPSINLLVNILRKSRRERGLQPAYPWRVIVDRREKRE